jgi:putative addiction module CopG family antidote
MITDHHGMADLKTGNVSLTPEIEAFLNDRITSGRFRSASEVVRADLRLLEDDERRREAPGQRGGRRDRHAPSRASPQE